MTTLAQPRVRELVTVNSWGADAIGLDLIRTGMEAGNALSAVYPSANLAIFVPFFLHRPMNAVKMFCWNGTVSGNVDVGIYAPDAGASTVTRIVSKGSTAQSGANVIQTFDITDTLIKSGLNYMAIAMDNTTGKLVRLAYGDVAATATFQVGLMGCGQAASSFALPATATMVTLANDFIPMFGLTGRPLV